MLDPEAEKFTERLYRMAKDTLHLLPEIIYNDVIQKLSVALVHGVARDINSKTCSLHNFSSNYKGPRERPVPDFHGN